MLRHLITHALAATFLAVYSHAVLLEVDLTGSPTLYLEADYGGNGLIEEEPYTNSGSPISVDVDFSITDAFGMAGWSTNIGASDSFYYTIDEDSYIDTAGSDGGDIILNTFITVNIVAETGETDGTPVLIDWTSAISGFYGTSSGAFMDLTVDSNTLFELSLENASSDETDFSDSDSGQLTSYNIGDSFTLEIDIVGTTTGVNEVRFYSGTAVTMSATVVPEPTSASLLLGATGLLAWRRRRS